MTDDPVATRYAQALFETAKASGQVEEALGHLSLLRRAMRMSPEVGRLLMNPGIELDEKMRIFNRTLGEEWSNLVRAFVRVVISFGRAGLLEEIIEAFEAIVDQARGRLRAVVRSARPLPEAVLERLRRGLERRERKEVLVETELAPELVGGVQIILDQRLIDGSVRRHLVELRQQLKSVRVNS
ncbi:MAG: ATP synthase F1 subunit delta [Candidatus Omnitrophica bacterium]|nr:ATP synthase F1 subunit delta [Candidatus Omnitrophota bacterium]